MLDAAEGMASVPSGMLCLRRFRPARWAALLIHRRTMSRFRTTWFCSLSFFVARNRSLKMRCCLSAQRYAISVAINNVPSTVASTP